MEIEKVNRRKALKIGSAGFLAIAIAGCSGTSSQSVGDFDCKTSVEEPDRNGIIETVMVAPSNGDKVQIRITIEPDDIKHIEILQVETDDLQHQISVENKRTYEQKIGQQPISGQYRIRAVSTAGTVSGEMLISFNCGD